MQRMLGTTEPNGLSAQKQGWTGLQQHEGADFLAWLYVSRRLSQKFEALAAAIWSLLTDTVRTPEDALAVWKAVPAVLRCCNSQRTYQLPGAIPAYAWIHLLDRYIRTWTALERLVEKRCLPMGKHGVRALDVGTGPGPSAFAIDDFYTAVSEFSELRCRPKWRQPPEVTCVELDRNANHFRHLLAEILFEKNQRKSMSVLSMCSALPDFGELNPTRERRQYMQSLRWQEAVYFDEDSREWVSQRVSCSEEASHMAQSLHRYRLVVFSNFLTTISSVKHFESNLVEMLQDAAAGSVVLLLGGRGGHYCDVYEYVDHIAKGAGFQLKLREETVSCKGHELADRVYEEGRKFYDFLQTLSRNREQATKTVRIHFEKDHRARFSSSEVRAYRKY